jgi:serralysin
LSQGRFYQGAEFAATVSVMNKLAVALGIAALVAIAGASSVRADHDPANECLGAGSVTQTIRGTAGNDSIVGTPGNDIVKGLAGDDTIDGGGGRDILCGEEGNDVIIGGDGGDSLDGGPGDDRLDGGAGFDLAFFRRSTAPVTASLATSSATGDGTDTFVALEGLSGSPLNDTLAGDSGDNLLDGFGGNDVLSAGAGIDALDGDAGNDVLDGGPGIDFVYYIFAPRGITANLGTRKARGWGTDTLRGIEDLEGSPFNDSLTGDARPNELNGGGGNDRAVGGAGNDMLVGEVGNDALFGGAGRDGLVGGKGQDRADGGPGRDRCSAERKLRCP